MGLGNIRVEYQYMRPRDLRTRREAMPVAYIGLGILEWHGLHNPLGLDGVKANGIACRLAEVLGGVVMPVQYWGDYRRNIAELAFDGSFLPDFAAPENNFDHTVLISELIGVDKSLTERDAERGKAEGKWEVWERLMLRTLFQTESLGFESIILIPGHFPLFQPLERAIKEYELKGGSCRTLILTDYVYDTGPFGGDHAAAFETSLMLALCPELVELAELDSDLGKANIGVIGPDPRIHASKELGERVIAKYTGEAARFLGIPNSDFEVSFDKL